MALLRALLAEWPLLLSMGSLLLVSVALLCGNWPVFNGTPIRSLHFWITGGACDCLQRILEMLCGAKGVQGYLYVEHICCERPNPILQLFYLSIILGAFGAYFYTSFDYIPGPYVSAFHRYSAPLAVMAGIGLFLAASFSDPGTLTPSNVAQLNTYEFDGILYQEKLCPTCHILRPARSKHCSICNRCIARFDHHCAWMNNCIGANNLRYFLLFLIWHCLLCWYGASVMVAILAGEVRKHRVMQRIAFFYGANSFYDKLPHLVHWIAAFYSLQFLLLLFLVILSILLLAFLSYHLLLVIRNTTTNEVYKWELHELWLAHEAGSELEGGQAPEQQGCCCCFGSNEGSKPKFTAYNRGAFNNFHEVLFPASRSWCKKEE